MQKARLWAILSLLSAGAAVLVSQQSTQAFHFRDVAVERGVTAAIVCGGPEKKWIPEANGSGAAWLDYDNDGQMDLLIVNGSDMDSLRRILKEEVPQRKGGVFLFHNLGNGRFEDATERAGLTNPYWGTGVNAADYDNDGFTDILITNIGRDLLYRNNGNGTFSEIGRSAGLSQKIAWHTGSGFGDFDGDGKLDLFITGYVDVHAISLVGPAPQCDYQGKKVFCGPVGLKGEQGTLYHNDGNNRFSDVTKRAGLDKVHPAHGFTVVADDFSGDGRTDLFVANDSDPNFLFLNTGNGNFTESALDRGVAFNSDGRAQANMGVAVGDLDHSGRMDLITTTFHQDYFPHFRQNAAGYFEEIASATGLGTVTPSYLGWGCGLTDFDNDGHREFWSANGHVYPQVPAYFQPFTIFSNIRGKFRLAFSYPSTPDNSYRGAAAADFDNDGRPDVVVLPISGQPLLLRNETESPGHWAGIRLKGTRSNRDAIGAAVRLEACGVSQFDTVRNGGGYLSHDDPRLHFGLGSCDHIDRITVKWPAGGIQLAPDVAVDRYTTLQEPF